MAESRIDVSDADMERARQDAATLANQPLASKVDYIRDLNLLIVHLTNGTRLALPVEQLQGLADADAEQLQDHELVGGGVGIHFPQIDEDFYVPALLDGIYGSLSWMEHLAQQRPKARPIPA